MGFSSQWVDFMMKCISIVLYYVCLNGNLRPSFHPTRGLRKEDPLSPYLLLICSEGLHPFCDWPRKKGEFVESKLEGVALQFLIYS